MNTKLAETLKNNRKIKALFTSVFFLLLFSCDNIPKKEITIIDDIVLGQNIPSLYKQMDSLSIPHKGFLKDISINNYNAILDKNSYTHLYYSDIFNFSDERSIYNEHFGLLWPIALTGTDNNVSLIVLLGHTREPILEGEAKNYANSISEKYFKQDVNKNVIEKIEELYISKYGKPTYEWESELNSIYVIEKDGINQYLNDKRIGKEIIWKTKYIDIKLFKGLDSYDCSYNTIRHNYSHIIWRIGESKPVKDNLGSNDIPSYSYAYIKYELNEEAIKKLNLKKIKI
jgi:hypothetical protein